jgi:ribosomal-protein-alanine N-acetyltransferase
VKLSVRRSNQPAIQLYQKLGYAQVDVWSNYYHDGEDGIVMAKKIQDSGFHAEE